MQNTQEINWWLEIAKIAVPSLITLAIGFWLSRKTENHKKDLSKEIEDYKKDLNKELESHKIHLQSDFQTKFYEFQTRYSLLHQQRAEIIKELYEHLVKSEDSFNLWARIAYFSVDNTRDAVHKEAQANFLRLIEFYRSRRIFFDMEICEQMDNMIDISRNYLFYHHQIKQLKAISDENMSKLYKQMLDKELSSSEKEEGLKNINWTEKAHELNEEATLLMKDKIKPIIASVEKQFRQLLSAELPNYQLEKIQLKNEFENRR